MNMGYLTFTSGTQPHSAGSQMCLDISIIDDDLVEGTEMFVVCASYEGSATTILFEDNTCRDIFIEDNDGILTIISLESNN